MKVIHFLAENVKRLRAVEISPEGNVVEITGLNGQGKTSVLDSLWWALAGTSTHQGAPIRNGAKKAQIRLDLGELTVTRKFRKGEKDDTVTSLVVENAEGVPLKAPQSLLDGMIGALAFDPLDFLRSDPKKQFKILQNFVPEVDFYAIETAHNADYQERTFVNRDLKAAEAAAKAFKIEIGSPKESVDVSALMDEYESLRERNGQIQAAWIGRDKALGDANALKVKIEKGQAQIKQWQREEAELRELAEATLPTQLLDVSEVRTKIDTAEEINAIVAQRKERKKHLDRAEDLQLKSDEITARMEARQKAKQKAIAEAQMPVAGLGFGDGHITLNGVPFDQASDAEQLRASVAIAMAGDPKLRIVRVRDGSLLDANSMKLLEEMAVDRDFQVWVETVGDGTNGRPAVIIEDGQVVEAVTAAEVPF